MNNIRFKILVFFFSLLTPIVSLGQYSCFDMIKSNRLPLTSFNRPDEKAYQNFERLIDQLFVSDQKVRSMDTKHFFKYAPIVDSVNFSIYRDFMAKNGFVSTIRRENKSVTDPDKFRLRNWTLQIHFSDRDGLNLLKMIEQAIDKHQCDEIDLMDYFITYLWRKTEFDGFIHTFLLPDIEHSKYKAYYLQALNAYASYCQSRNPFFYSFTASNVLFEKSHFKFSDMKIRSRYNHDIKSNYDKHPLIYADWWDKLIMSRTAHPKENERYWVFVSNSTGIISSPDRTTDY